MGHAVIAWHDGPSSSVAYVRVRALCIARLHARRDGWRVELLDGELAGTAGSLGHAKRDALQALCDAVQHLPTDLRSALGAG